MGMSGPSPLSVISVAIWEKRQVTMRGPVLKVGGTAYSVGGRAMREEKEDRLQLIRPNHRKKNNRAPAQRLSKENVSSRPSP